MSKKIMAVAAAVILMSLAACSKLDQTLVDAANTAMNAAKSGQADIYAPAEFKAAQDKLNSAMAMAKEQDEKFALFRSYTEVGKAYTEASTMMAAAQQAGEAAKEAMKQELTGMMTNIQAMLDSTGMMIDKAPVGKGNKADIELIKSSFEGIKAAYTEAGNAFNAGNYMDAKARLENVVQQATGIKTEIENAMAMKAGKGAMPAKGGK